MIVFATHLLFVHQKGFKDFFYKILYNSVYEEGSLKMFKEANGNNFAKNILFMFIQYDHLLLGFQTTQALISMRETFNQMTVFTNSNKNITFIGVP